MQALRLFLPNLPSIPNLGQGSSIGVSRPGKDLSTGLAENDQGDAVNALSGERILIAWERGLSMPEPWRPLALLELAMPETDIATLASMPLAERNAKLLELRSISFGRAIEAFATCPLCDAPLEFVLNADDLRRNVCTAAEETWIESKTEMHMRVANSNDLAAVVDSASEDDACAMLLARTMGIENTDVDFKAHSDWLTRFEHLNAVAETVCALTCEACAERSEIDFDIAGFLWREVGAAARRLLSEIHRLASAYGWSEREIAAMNPARRNAYLEMLNS
jgi:hypothetical protein